jgi:toxoflavin biosynthesis protein ToxD
MAQPRIFVSHSHKDEVFTERLVADLHLAGAEVWVDVAGLTHGNFMQRIDEALAQCEWMVLVLTPNAVASQYVKDEVYAALVRVTQGYMRDVIPVLAAPCAPGTIPPQWDAQHRYDATNDYSVALAGVLHAVGLPPIVPTQAQMPVAPQSVPAPASVQSVEHGIVGGVERDIPAERFPPRLAELGFEGRVINGVEVIIPPVCDVPAGQFQFRMGSKFFEPGAADNERPDWPVTLPAFQIGRFPVTVAEYACFVRAGQREPQRAEFEGEAMDWQTQLQRLDHPVVCVTWNDAREYTSWLSYVTGQPWRLPTEAEWEKAARGTDGRIYPWGDAFEQWRCNTSGSGKNSTTPVGAYPGGASPCGALDMAGNVGEWTSSLYMRYPYSVGDGREVVNSPSDRTIRSCGWSATGTQARSAHRFPSKPDNVWVSTGFRLARVVSSS